MKNLELEIKDPNSPINGFTISFNLPENLTTNESINNWMLDWSKAAKNTKVIEPCSIYSTHPTTGENMILKDITVDGVVIYPNGRMYPPITQENIDQLMENIKDGYLGELTHPDNNLK